jgi:phosphohistidine phosphatase
MKLYFLRHGIAADREEWDGDDAQRPLTADGRKSLEREAKTLARLDIEPDRIITSPLARAKETAEIIAQRLDLRDRIVEDDRLAESFDVNRLAEIVRECSDVDCLMFVGHEPDFSRTIGQITGGARVDLKKGGIARVDLPDSSTLAGELLWLVPPKLLYG